ncbi:MAG TPA: glycine dehydrogenase (aminomethyl-transferring), partial [Acidimicrobiia bacterium]
MEVLTDFSRRHLGPRPTDIAKMLAELGVGSVDELIAETLPGAIRIADELRLPPALSEPEALAEMRRLSETNQIFTSMIGLGYYDTFTPSVILRNVLENPAWYTAYTPYQPEISQGRLELLLTFQTMVADLTGLDVANASLLDEGTAAAEAMTMCRRLAKGDRKVFWVDGDCHPQTIAVVETRAEPVAIEVRIADPGDFEFDDAFGALVAYPGSSGALSDHRSVVEAAHAAGSLVAVVSDLLALTILSPPGEFGADIALGSSQRFGVPLGFGGPHAAFIATRQSMVRALPGRLVGVSKDVAGRTAFRLALQTREQHIRREKATSNVCTAQVLLAVMAALYACWHGSEGLAAIARRVNHLTGRMAASLASAGISIENQAWFDTLTVIFPGRAQQMIEAARDRHINLRSVDEDRLGMSFDETTTERHLQLLAEAFGIDLLDEAATGFPSTLSRQGEFLTHEVFSRYRSEHEMLRYLRRLADKDLALDRTMIPLGSCTMKLNAASEMIPIGFEGFARIHPFAPPEQTPGYRELI